MTTQKKKGFTLVEIMIVVVIIGLLAAMAIPAFQQVREQSRQKTVVNNLRQVAAAGQQYILEEGVTQVDYATLTTLGYFSPIAPVAEETYTDITITQDGGTLTIDVNGETVSFSY